MSVLTLGIFFTLVVLGSPQLAGAVVFLALIFIAVVFYFGGKKLGNMLRNGKAKQAGGDDYGGEPELCAVPAILC